MVALGPPASGSAGTGSASRRTAVVEAVEKVQPCVVSISSEKMAASHSRWPFSPEENQRPRVSGMGSGVLDRRPRLYSRPTTTWSTKFKESSCSCPTGRVIAARVLQFDPVMDLAVLKIDPDHSLAAVEHRDVVGPDGRRDGDHDRQCVRLREHGFGRDHQCPASRRDAFRRPGLPQPDPDRRLHQPGQLGRSADQRQRRADRDQRGGSRRCSGDRVCLADRRGQAGCDRDAEHAPAGVDLAWARRQ